MARTSNVFARVDPEVKRKAEIVLDQLGISMAGAVEMFLRQVALQGGLPFEVKLPSQQFLDYSAFDEESFDSAIQRSVESIQEGRTFSANEFKKSMEEEFNL